MTPTSTKSPNQNLVRIAIPVTNGRLHSHFGGCGEFALVDADAETRAVIATQTLPAPPHAPGVFPRWLREQGAKVVIVGGIGQRALDNFALHGITVRSGQPESTVETIAADFLAGRLSAVPVGCTHHGDNGDHHHHHGHDHAHS